MGAILLYFARSVRSVIHKTLCTPEYSHPLPPILTPTENGLNKNTATQRFLPALTPVNVTLDQITDG